MKPCGNGNRIHPRLSVPPERRSSQTNCVLNRTPTGTTVNPKRIGNIDLECDSVKPRSPAILPRAKDDRPPRMLADHRSGWKESGCRAAGFKSFILAQLPDLGCRETHGALFFRLRAARNRGFRKTDPRPAVPIHSIVSPRRPLRSTKSFPSSQPAHTLSAVRTDCRARHVSATADRESSDSP